MYCIDESICDIVGLFGARGIELPLGTPLLVTMILVLSEVFVFFDNN